MHQGKSGVPYKKSDNYEKINLKIGNPNTTIFGLNLYTISYNVLGAVSYFEDYDELYWNAIGTDWNVPILSAKVFIDITDLNILSSDSINVTCYTGIFYSKEQNCGIQKTFQRL